MTPDQFIKRRQADWDQLEKLLNRLGRRSVTQLSEREIRTLGDLYRAASADLALAQRDFPRHDVSAFLNNLVGRAHHAVYQGEGVERRQIRDFLTTGFPGLFRRNWRYVAVAALLLFTPWAISWTLTANDPELVYLFAPGAEATLQSVVEEGKLWIDISTEESSSAGALIMTNNIRVALLAFAGGALAGLLTIYVLIMNGLSLGAIFGFVQAYGLGPELGEFVIGHGPIELSVICIAGGAGLRFGHAMIVPGLMRRRDAIAQAAREAMGLVTGGALLLIVAGIIEGFISPSALPWPVKALVGVGSGLLMYLYLLLSGRDDLARPSFRRIVVPTNR
jgi:uncharacterized membrane protein SpoIIM required for sporulation